MDNPLKRVLEARGLKPADVAFGTGVSVSYVCQIVRGETGCRLPRKIFDFLSALGEDPAEIEKEFERFRELRREEILEATMEKKRATVSPAKS